MPGGTTVDKQQWIRAKFAERRGILCVIMTVDGTHVPWVPNDARFHEDYHNYKGWYLLSCLMFVNSFYMFVDAEIGHPGRASDVSIAEHSWILNQIRANRELWLGHDGILIGDGGFGTDDFLMNSTYSCRCMCRYC